MAFLLPSLGSPWQPAAQICNPSGHDIAQSAFLPIFLSAFLEKSTGKKEQQEKKEGGRKEKEGKEGGRERKEEEGRKGEKERRAEKRKEEGKSCVFLQLGLFSVSRTCSVFIAGLHTCTILSISFSSQQTVCYFHCLLSFI